MTDQHPTNLMQVDSLCGNFFFFLGGGGGVVVGGVCYKNPLWLKESQFFKLEIVCSLLFSLLNLFCLATELEIKMALVDC